MAHEAKSKATALSASSFLDLKAEISKQSSERRKGGRRNVLENESKKGGRIWARTNKGVQGRAARDLELEAISKPTLERAQAALERKAKIYDKLRRGKTGGLSEGQIDTLLVDVRYTVSLDTYTE
jgi:hypothetical protein